MVFVFSQESWLQVKTMRHKLVFSKKEFEGKFEQSAHGEGGKQLRNQKPVGLFLLLCSVFQQVTSF